MSRQVTKTYVEFYFPGTLLSETDVRAVRSRDPSKVKAPSTCFGFRFFNVQETRASNGEVLNGRPKNYSGMHYFGKVKTLAEIKRESPDLTTLIGNMEGNGYDRVVLTRRGNYQPFTGKDVIIGSR